MISKLRNMVREYRKVNGKKPSAIHAGTWIIAASQKIQVRFNGPVDFFGPIIYSFDGIPIKVIKDPLFKDRTQLLP